jgi:hypothetical protein
VGVFGDQLAAAVAVERDVDRLLLDVPQSHYVLARQVVRQPPHRLSHPLEVRGELEHLEGGAGDFFEEVEGVAVVQGLVVGVVIGVGLLQQEGPDLDGSLLGREFADVEEERDVVAVGVGHCGHVVVDDDVLPHVFLEYLDQVYSELVGFGVFENASEYEVAVLEAGECVADEVVAGAPAVAIDLDVAAGGGEQGEGAVLEELGQPHPADVVEAGVRGAGGAAAVDRGEDGREEFVLVFLVRPNAYVFPYFCGKFGLEAFEDGEVSFAYNLVCFAGSGFPVVVVGGVEGAVAIGVVGGEGALGERVGTCRVFWV